MQNFMTTILSAIQAWTKGKIRASTADWNQNDPNADNYVKNRPFWEDDDGTIHKINKKYLSLPSNIATTEDIEDVRYEAELAQASANYAQETADSKMSTENPTGVGSFSMNRRSDTTVGECSIVTGYDSAACGQYSHAAGLGVKTGTDNQYVGGKYNIPENAYTTSYYTDRIKYNKYYYASKEYTFDTATGRFYLVNPEYVRLERSNYSGYYLWPSNYTNGATFMYYVASASYNSDATRTIRYYNVSKINSAVYSHIIGNGTSDTERSNAHTLDWDGNAWYQGDIYVGSSSGTNKDDGSKKLATEEYVDSAIESQMAANKEDLAQPDWNATEGQPGHIANRTHYKELDFAPVIDTTVSYDSYEAGFYVYSFTPVVGNRYKVSIDGDAQQEFTLTEDMIYVYEHSSNGKTYTLNFYTGWYSIYIVVSDDSEDSFSLRIDTIQDVYHIIPEEYLPKLVGRVYEGSDCGEIFNDVDNVASGSCSHAEGYHTKATAAYTHAEGEGTKASSLHSHAEGKSTEASGCGSHAEGTNTIASADESHAEGNSTVAAGSRSHAEGYYTEALGDNSHAEGYGTLATGDCSHVEGRYNHVRRYILGEPVSNNITYSRQNLFYADGYVFNETNGTFYLSDYSKSTRDYTVLTEGQYFATSKLSQDAIKKFVSYDGTNISYEEICPVGTSEDINKYAHMVGNGDSEKSRSNAHTLDWEGNAWFAGTVEGTALILPSSSIGSTKQFKITVDDNGTLMATEI